MRAIVLIVAIAVAGCGKKEEAPGRTEGEAVKILDRFDPKDEAAADRLTLAHLAKAGADLTKETHVIHYLYFASRARAEEARGRLGEGYKGSIDEGGDQVKLVVEQNIVPSEANIAAARVHLTKIAAEVVGEYDGWEAAVTP